MSDTDKTRPAWVQMNDHYQNVTVWHCFRCHRSGGADCDLPLWPVDKHHNQTNCSYRPTRELWMQINGGTYISLRSRKIHRRSWFASERTQQRAILRSLTRDALYGGEVDEDCVDNRQTHRHTDYGGGWWD